MKFLLKERFILEERFILNEADDDLANIQSIIDKAYKDNFHNDKFRALINALQTTTDKGAVDAIKKAAEEADAQIANKQADWSILTSKIKAYCNVLKAEIDKNKDGGAGSTLRSLKGVAGLINKTEDLCETTPTDDNQKKTAITNLTASYNNLKNAVDNSIAEDSKVDATTSATIEDVVENQKLLAQTIARIKEAKNVSAEEIGKLRAFATTLQDNKILSDGAEVSEGTWITQSVDSIDRVAEACRKLDEEINLAPTAEETEKAANSDSWADAFNQEGTLEEKQALWDSYYKEAWGDKADKVRALGEAFTQELLELGFTEATNPFITFVKNNLDRLGLNVKNYAAIHNAFVNGYIDSDNLKSPAGSLLGNPILYEEPGPTILRYLDAEHDLKEEHVQSELYGNGAESETPLLVAIFTDGINIQKGQKAPTNSLSNIAKLRSLSGIAVIVKNFTGKDINKAQKASANTELIWTRMCNSNPATARQVLRQIADKFGTPGNKLIDNYGDVAQMSPENRKKINNALQEVDIKDPVKIANELWAKIQEAEKNK